MRHRLIAATVVLTVGPAFAATTQKHYYAHDAVEDEHGVIAPWYQGANGQIDLRVRIAAETLKRYPWTTRDKAPAVVPEYVFSGAWRIDKEGHITIPPIKDWANGDFGQRAAYLLAGWVDYYRYSGDAAAIAHMSLTADTLLDYCLTPDDHPWPRFLISVPTRGKPYGQADPRGFIQLDNSAETGIPLVKAAQIVGGERGARWMKAAQHWGDLLAEKRDRRPGVPPWGRYANPQDVPWEDNMTGNVVFLLEFFDTLIAAGYTGRDNAIVEARKAGVVYLQQMLDQWLVHDTWGRNFWDWNAPVQLENVTEFVARYVMEHPDEFPNWRTDARNILTLFLNRTAASPKSNADTFSGAWAYPESSGCCGRSLWYGPMEIAPMYAQLGAMAGDPLMSELGRRQMILATYDVHETGVVEDNIDGGQIVAGAWFKIAHPMALKHCLNMIAWQPEVFAPPGENHIVRSTGVVKHVQYLPNRIEYTTAPTKGEQVEVLRLASEPTGITFVDPDDDRRRVQGLKRDPAPGENGFAVKPLPGGDCLVEVRHTGINCLTVPIEGARRITLEVLEFDGNWLRMPQPELLIGSLNSFQHTQEAGASVSARFEGNWVQVLGKVGPEGGLADVYLDDVRQLVPVDCWNPEPLSAQVLYSRSGLAHGAHHLKIVARGRGNPVSRGREVYINGVFHGSDRSGSPPIFPAGAPVGPQRWIFGYPERTDYVDSEGNAWRPATEWVIRAGNLVDAVAAGWWTARRCHEVAGTADPELYRYGAHGKEFWANVTVSPGTYHVRLKFVETRNIEPKLRAMNVAINGREVVREFDIASTAAGAPSQLLMPIKRWSGLGRAVDLVFNGIQPKNGIIEVRFTGSHGGEAIVQAIEVGPGDGGQGATPISVPSSRPAQSAAP